MFSGPLFMKRRIVRFSGLLSPPALFHSKTKRGKGAKPTAHDFFLKKGKNGKLIENAKSNVEIKESRKARMDSAAAC